MAKDKIVFFGTAGLCIPYLEQLKERFDLQLIVTQPDALGGRHRKKMVPPVKQFALDHDIPLIQPDQLKCGAVADQLLEIQPAIGVVIAYGKLIPRKVFTVPHFNMVNVHFSLLPQYRGAAPVQRALEHGETFTGITIFEIAKKLDSGDIWSQKEFPIQPDDTTEVLFDRLSRDGAPFLTETLEKIIGGDIAKVPQDHDKATFAPPIEKGEGKIDWQLTAGQLYNKFRAFSPWPGLHFHIQELLVNAKKIRPIPDSEELRAMMAGKEPGDVLVMNKDSLKVCCGQHTALEILEMQPQCKKPMSPYCYSLGNPIPEKLN
jgi:methionyl-tRNA formyltransferase